MENMVQPTQINPEAEVTAEIPSEVPITSMPIQSDSKKNIFLLLGVAALLLVVGVAGYYLGSSNSKTVKVADTNSAEDSELSESEAEKTAPVVEQAQSLAATLFGFKVAYPAGWQVQPAVSANGSTVLTINEAEMKMVNREGEMVLFPASPRDPEKFAMISITYPGSNEQSLDEIAANTRTGSLTNITVGGEEAIQIVLGPNPESEQLVDGGSSVTVLVKNLEGKIISIRLETANLELYQPIFEKMLKSIVFSE